MDHELSELSTMTHLSWVTLQGMAHSFIELDKALVHVIRLVRVTIPGCRLLRAHCGDQVDDLRPSEGRYEAVTK